MVVGGIKNSHRKKITIMNFLNIIYWGWYHILDKTVYLYGRNNGGFGLREHAFFVSFLLHIINLWTLVRYIFIKYFEKTTDLYIPIFISLIVFTLGYFKFLRNKKADLIISSEARVFKEVVMLVLTLIYSIVTVYCMIEVGNYVRQSKGHDFE